MNKDQLEMAKVFLEVLTHIRQQFDILIEHGDTHFALNSAFESGEVMIETMIQAAEFTNAEKRSTEERERAITIWSVQFRQDCSAFCKKHDLPTRIENTLSRLSELTRQWKVWTTTIGGRYFEIVTVPLQAKAFKATLPVDEYPKFIDAVEEIVNGDRVVGQIGRKYQDVLGEALLAEWAKYVKVGREVHREMQDGTDD